MKQENMPSSAPNPSQTEAVADHRSGGRPPWGLQTPKSKQQDRKNAAFMSTYDRMFQGLKGTPARPIRQSTAPHINEGMWVDRTAYKESFRTPHHYSRHHFVPASVNRHHRPHPSQLVWPLEPNKSYMVWKPEADLTPPRRPTVSAPATMLQFNKQRSMNTTYGDFFKGHLKLDLLGNIPRTAANGERNRPTTEDQRIKTASRPATIGEPIDTTSYRRTYQGEFGRPSTLDRPPDRSWANIRY